MITTSLRARCGPCCGVAAPACAAEECRTSWGVSDNKISVIGYQNSGVGGSGFPLFAWYGVGTCDWNDYLDLGQFGTETPFGTPFGVSPPLVGTTGVNGVTVTISGPTAAEIRNIGSTFTGDLGPGVGDSVPAELAAGSGTGIGVGDELLFVDPEEAFTIEFSGGSVYAAAVALSAGVVGKTSMTVEVWDSGGNNTSLTFDHDTNLYSFLSWDNGSVQVFPAQGKTITKMTIDGGADGLAFGHLALCTSKATSPPTPPGLQYLGVLAFGLEDFTDIGITDVPLKQGLKEYFT